MNITQETNQMGIFIKFESDTDEDIQYNKEREYWKKKITCEIYKKLYDSKEFDRVNMKKIYDLLKDNMNG